MTDKDIASKEGSWKELIRKGDIVDSTKILEDEVKKTPDNSMAWMYLGTVYAEDDKDTEALRALETSVKLDPNNLAARVLLSVSLANELQLERSMDVLYQWIKRNPMYSAIANQYTYNEKQNDTAPQSMVNPFIDEDNPFLYQLDTIGIEYKQKTIIDMFTEASRVNLENPDPDVHIILGILDNVRSDYESAVNHFKLALEIRPDDYQLWNKLGATLTNGSRPQEALSSYYKALEINPSYVRARANLGIAFMNMADYPNAAKNLLHAISMRPNVPNHMWDTLTNIFLILHRDDLVTKSRQKDVSLLQDDLELF
ncbi:tetratricopeptide-like helical domain-containing protein (TPR) [Tieghemostelium lacteum]|uniref:Tetratricopeptide-like helical domain-containing protein (TPR) n=1 Tax=Tieghemostelium lacteum TaxID=361077 RepID=A0A152A5X3_TIELA|nr:tetratricopeptide-like helical domain-containing protein (TPR) [Tieghemostelium lacteum]|eukprot:KYR01636.1 tetratricopeptide-like helical domain-containing protein (TPR) [Tieghemostelium lacteum]